MRPSANRFDAWAAALLLGLAACGRHVEATALVRGYDDAVVEAYRTNDASGVKAVATPEEWRRVFALVDLKKAGGLVLESRLELLEVSKEERPNPRSLVVETHERWRYWDRAIVPGKPAGTVFVSDMKMRYTFTRDADAAPLKVHDVRTLSNEFLEPKGYQLPQVHSEHGADHDGHGARGGARAAAPPSAQESR